MLGWSEMISNHITLNVLGEDGAFLIYPYGLHFSEVTASNLVKIDIEDNKLDNSSYPVNLAGFTQHSAFHRHLPDAHCIIHIHTTAGIAVTSVESGLTPTNFYACNFIGQIAYHDFEGITVRAAEGERLVEHFGDKRVMLLRNHGTLVMESTLPEAFIMHWALQRTCEIRIATASFGTPVRVANDVVAVRQRDLVKSQLPGGAGETDLEAMVRLVDRIDTTWRN